MIEVYLAFSFSGFEFLMMAKKYVYALILCLTLAVIVLGKIVGVSDSLAEGNGLSESSSDLIAGDCMYHADAYQGLAMSKLEGELETTGLIGRVHGSAGSGSGLFMISIREPNNFFAHREFSLIARQAKPLATLEGLNRHDRICIQGNILPNPSPQVHIDVQKIQVLEAWPQPENIEPYEREADLPADLESQTNFIGKVHAIGAEGKILVMEYLDRVVPVFVETTDFTRDLYRGDIVKLHYQIQKRPQQPIHLQLDTTAAQPIEVLDAIASWHNHVKTITGNLVKFPRSPQLKFDVYAIEAVKQGIRRDFTLVNFEDIAEFSKIREKLAALWEENSSTAVAGRNMLINPEVMIEASGKINLISTEQANPQILLKSAQQVRKIN